MKTETRFPQIRNALYSTPWAITTDWLETICSIFEAHVAGADTKPFVQKISRGRRCPKCEVAVLKPVMEVGAMGKVHNGDYTCPNCGCQCSEDDLPPYEIIDGCAILDLSGPLFPKANLLTMLSGATSYEKFISDFWHAMNNPQVSNLIILSDSPGGSCLRLSETCSSIFAARELGTKKILGLVDPMCCSAAYAIVSQCHESFVTESGMVGSIGTVMKYNNWERAERNEGNDPVLLASSDIKAFGTPQSLAQYQSLIDMLLAYFEQFKEIVQRGRNKIDIAAVSGAKVWIGKDAVRMGLVDGISSLEKIIQAHGKP